MVENKIEERRSIGILMVPSRLQRFLLEIKKNYPDKNLHENVGAKFRVIVEAYKCID